MHPSAIKRAVYYMQKNNLDHMVVGPQLKISGKMPFKNLIDLLPNVISMTATTTRNSVTDEISKKNKCM